MGKWYIIQTRPRWERKVADRLEGKGFETFYPVLKVKRQWSDRVKTVEEPFLRGCVLVKITEEQKTEVRLMQGAVNFIYYNGKPVHPKEKDIRLLQKQLSALRILNKPSEAEDSPKQESFYSDLFQLDNIKNWMKVYTERPKLI